MCCTDWEHLGGAWSLLWIPHQHGFYKIIEIRRPVDRKHLVTSAVQIILKEHVLIDYICVNNVNNVMYI